MENKHEYMIWREKNGFFTALNRRGVLKTWSILSGKLLYQIIQPDDSACSPDALAGYEVFKGDPQDITYTRNFYNLPDCSVNLLKSQEPFNEHNVS